MEEPMKFTTIVSDESVPESARVCRSLARSQALLSKKELKACRSTGLRVGFDPVQQAWVLLDFVDDIDPSATDDVVVPNHSVVQLNKRRGPRSSKHSPEITFRQWRVQDLPCYKALLDDPDVWELLPEPYPDPLTDDLAKSLIQLSNETGHHDVRAVLVDGEPVGQVRIVFRPDDPARENAEISYWLGRHHWGLGIGARMVGAYVEEVAARFPSIATLMARIHRENTASVRVAQKAGFHNTGVAEHDPNIEVYSMQLAAGLAENAGLVQRFAKN
jgi:RimJ/RimL family protein N-acetyltransferase